jgi:predicted transcriptional regulator
MIAEMPAFEEAQIAKIKRGLADAEAGRFASPERIARVLAKYKPRKCD